MRPPRNIYTDKGLTPGQRIFYDIRGELGDFLGGALGGALGGGGITSGGILIQDNKMIDSNKT